MKVRNFIDIKALLFDNLTIKQTIFKNIFWLAVSHGLSRLMTLILLIFVARILGAAEYGKFTFAIAFVYLLSVFSDLGISSIATREFSREKEREKEFSAILSLKIFLILGTVILTFIGSFFITSDPIIRGIIWILVIYNSVNCFSEIIYAFLRARQRMEYESFAKILHAFLITGFGFFVILNFPSVKNLSYSYLFASLIFLILVLVFFHFKIYRLSLTWNKFIWQRFLAMSWPLALVAIFTAIHNYVDSTMMGYFGQITQTGWYNAALKIVQASLIPAALISQSFYPALSIAFKESKEKLQKVWSYQMETLLFLAVPLMVGGITLAPRIIDFIYDSSYFPSILAFQILIIMAALVFLYYPFNQVLIVSNQQTKVFWPIFWGVIVNVILNLILIPKFSLYGAAVATVITNLLIFFLLFTSVLKFTFVNPFNLRFLLTFIGVVFSSAGMYFVISQPAIFYLNVLLSVPIGAGVYFGSFLGYRKLVKQIFIIPSVLF
ncbi:MAG: flippase [Patescibacteria group bacterium]|nr:flippase [Patescibacteria group bacterium]